MEEENEKLVLSPRSDILLNDDILLSELNEDTIDLNKIIKDVNGDLNE